MIIHMKKSIKEKVEKELPEFAESCTSMSVQDLNLRLSQLAKDLEAVETDKEENEELARLKEQIKELNGPYRDARKTLRNKIRYVIDLLKE